MRIDGAKRRWHAPRLLGVSALGFGALVLVMLVFSGGAGAAAGDADLALSKTDSPDPVVVGNNVTYTITVTNPAASTGPATNVVVTDNLPGDVDFVSATGGVCQHNANTVTCDLGQVNAGSSAVVTIVVKTKKDGTLSNTASVTSTPDEDPVLSNNSATATTTVNKAAKTPKPNKGKKPKKGKTSCATPTIVGTNGNDVITGTSH